MGLEQGAEGLDSEAEGLDREAGRLDHMMDWSGNKKEGKEGVVL